MRDNKKENKNWYMTIINFFKAFIMNFLYIFYYAFIGLKACTFDLFVFLYNSISWRTGKAYQKTKDALNTNNDKERDKKAKVYKYSARTMAKLEAEYQELLPLYILSYFVLKS